MVLVKDDNYLDMGTCVIDRDEFIETAANIKIIIRRVLKYLDDYIKHVRGTSVLDVEAFDRRYRYSTLPYFHNEMAIQESTDEAAATAE
jgi:hypothetical protein